MDALRPSKLFLPLFTPTDTLFTTPPYAHLTSTVCYGSSIVSLCWCVQYMVPKYVFVGSNHARSVRVWYELRFATLIISGEHDGGQVSWCPPYPNPTPTLAHPSM